MWGSNVHYARARTTALITHTGRLEGLLIGRWRQKHKQILVVEQPKIYWVLGEEVCYDSYNIVNNIIYLFIYFVIYVNDFICLMAHSIFLN